MNTTIMESLRAHLIYFSPTFTSKRVAEAIVQGTGIKDVSHTDLTRARPPKINISADTLTIIAVPVYGGKVAPLAMERLERLRGEDTPVVLVAVYGNRAYENALVELDCFAARHGFNVIGAATFVGEHSYSTKAHPISAGRPNADDLAMAATFGEEIVQKVLAAGGDCGRINPVDVSMIRKPKQPFTPLMGFFVKMVKLRRSGIAFPKAPTTNPQACTGCGICVELCPNAAIEAGNECNTKAERCIKCCVCVKKCPKHARTLQSPMAPLLSRYFEKQKLPQTLL